MRLACVPCVVRNTCPRCTVGPRASPSVARASRISHHASCTFNSIQRTREASFHDDDDDDDDDDDGDDGAPDGMDARR